jgi:hypothetical protein
MIEQDSNGLIPGEALLVVHYYIYTGCLKIIANYNLRIYDKTFYISVESLYCGNLEITDMGVIHK